MAKKVVAKLKVKGKGLAKVIRPLRSPKTGAYTFKSVVVPADEVEKYLSERPAE